MRQPHERQLCIAKELGGRLGSGTLAKKKQLKKKRSTTDREWLQNKNLKKRKQGRNRAVVRDASGG